MPKTFVVRVWFVILVTFNPTLGLVPNLLVGIAARRQGTRRSPAASPANLLPKLFHSKSGDSMDNKSLLERWLQHDTLEFHYFTPEEAAMIRKALLGWYDKHRRKLPWRGDPPPWEGSTADFANKKASKKNQKKIDDFFAKPSSSKSSADDLPTFPVTPYGVWVSEIMLQQTRVEAVIPYWVRWMQSFPTVTDLAQATEEQVNAHFAGLGFYRRARLLHQACQHLVERNDGVMPKTSEALMDLPGVGRYTACAIASIAHGEKVAVLDGNVCRVLSRLRAVANHIKAPAFKDKYGWDLAQQLIESGDGSRPGDLNQALMELGATYCSPSASGTDRCDPLVDFYWSTRIGHEYIICKELEAVSATMIETKKCPVCAGDGVEQALKKMSELSQKQTETTTKESPDTIARQCGHGALPLAPPKATRREEVLAVAVLSSEDGSYLLVKRPAKGLLAGQWEFPAACVWTSEGKVVDGQVPNIALSTRRKALDALLSEVFAANQVKLLSRAAWQRRCVQSATAEHIFSHVRHTMWIEHKSIPTSEYNSMARSWKDSEGREIRWMTQTEMSDVGITSGVKKVLKVVGSNKSPRKNEDKAIVAKQPSSQAKKRRTKK